MSNVIKFPGHHMAFGYCTTCDGSATMLPTHCPGEMMDCLTKGAVSSGAMDFKRGDWWYYGVRAEEVFDEK